MSKDNGEAPGSTRWIRISGLVQGIRSEGGEKILELIPITQRYKNRSVLLQAPKQSDYVCTTPSDKELKVEDEVTYEYPYSGTPNQSARTTSARNCKKMNSTPSKSKQNTRAQKPKDGLGV